MGRAAKMTLLSTLSLVLLAACSSAQDGSLPSTTVAPDRPTTTVAVTDEPTTESVITTLATQDEATDQAPPTTSDVSSIDDSSTEGTTPQQGQEPGAELPIETDELDPLLAEMDELLGELNLLLNETNATLGVVEGEIQ